MIVTDNNTIRSGAELLARVRRRFDDWFKGTQQRPSSTGEITMTGSTANIMKTALSRDRAHANMSRNQLLAKGVLKSCVQHDRIMLQVLYGESGS